MGNQAYNRDNVRQVKLGLNIKTDADIIQKLESVDNIQGYIKALIRADMKRYHVKPEYLSEWGEWMDEDSIVTQEEVERLASEWEKPVEELLEQLVEIR